MSGCAPLSRHIDEHVPRLSGRSFVHERSRVPALLWEEWSRSNFRAASNDVVDEMLLDDDDVAALEAHQ
jgi:hypothetical protein